VTVREIAEAVGKKDRAVRNWVVKAGAKNAADFRAAWKDLYQEIYYRLHMNVPVKARNEGVKPIDILDREGLIEQACAIAAEMLEQ